MSKELLTAQRLADLVWSGVPIMTRSREIVEVYELSGWKAEFDGEKYIIKPPRG